MQIIYYVTKKYLYDLSVEGMAKRRVMRREWKLESRIYREQRLTTYSGPAASGSIFKTSVTVVPYTDLPAGQ